MTSLSPTFDPTALNQFTNLPGQVYDVDGLCKQIHGNGSSFCRVRYHNLYWFSKSLTQIDFKDKMQI